MRLRSAAFAFAALLVSAPVLRSVAQEGGAPAAALTGAVGETQTGLAAVYSSRLNGHRTASGARYNSKALTAAHQTLPFGTKVKVTYLKTNKSVVVRINDRGPKQAGRILDLSRHAADSLGIRHGRHGGLVEVKLEVVEAAKK